MMQIEGFIQTDFQPGTVWLVGAGPGDPGLLTLHAISALQHCDVVVADALVSSAIMALIPENVDVVHMGKRGGKPSPRQPEISAKLIELAQAGHKVLRLKGGDPFMFGRSGEEAASLAAAGISFRIVPGVTAGIAGPAYAGIPVTTRETNSVISFVTGHDKTGETPPVDWAALAASSPGIVFYMPMNHLDEIRSNLLAAGRNPEEPAALISKATTPDQQILETTLGRLVEDAAASPLKPPAVLVLGDMVALRGDLSWFSSKSRAGEASSATTHLLNQ